ncbi:hypothetical protein SDC9_96208 [bioreactor metagenome]|uniref:Uncharacterized protein n=1 Tax=bioreactor metagenome TaxID=1076179 RepID=A0A645A9U4_9ZZZZ
MQADAAVAKVGHVRELGFALSEFLHHGADVFGRDIDGQFLNRLGRVALVVLAHDDLRTGDGELVSLAAHGLNQDREMQFAPAADAEGVGSARLLHTHGDVCLYLIKEAVAQIAPRDIFPFTAGKGAVVEHKHHAHGRLVDVHKRQRLNTGRVAERLTNVESFHTRDADNVPAGRLLHLGAL